MTHLLGLTGSIGMGKSTTAKMFVEEGVPVWDADAVVHDLYAKGGAAVPSFEQELPDAVIDGQVDRGQLREMISEDLNVLSKLEEIVHPLVAQNRADFLSKIDAPLVVFDIPLLFETKAQEWLTSVLVVFAPPNVQKSRVMARPDMTEEQFDRIMERQMPDVTKRALADHVIETCTLDQTRNSVRQLIAKLSEPENA